MKENKILTELARDLLKPPKATVYESAYFDGTPAMILANPIFIDIGSTFNDAWNYIIKRSEAEAETFKEKLESGKALTAFNVKA